MASEGCAVVYMPILKGKEGELKAIDHLPEVLAARVMPIFEVPPTSGDPIKDAHSFADRARNVIPRGMSVAVDARYLDDPDGGWRGPLQAIVDDFADWCVPIRPVLHLNDSERRLAEARQAAEMHDGQAVIRLGGDIADPDEDEAEAALAKLCRRAGTTIEKSALVLDFFDVRSERDIGRVEALARKCLVWARRYPWESITVASGAMPESISDLPYNIATPIPRRDLALWRRLQDPDVIFGDYGVAHPKMTVKGWPPPPNLRYTDEDVWWIYRWARDGNGYKSMYDLCASLVAADHWPAEGPAYSWGDAEIAQRAAVLGGPGNAAGWRAWGTAHHLTHVLKMLEDSHDDTGG
ncbi:beta family protein [Actinoplanes sp. NPDC051861]|uniref:beta family protein n=1 Tax=Actinoplanes sp. NPDC051861 TaxID=3155170 RepID=UPI00341F341D